MFDQLISVAELKHLSKESHTLIVDCRHHLMEPEKGEALYRHSHISGAYYAHLDHDLSSPIVEGSGRHPLPDMDKLQAFLSSVGLTKDSQVVVYDDLSGAIAVRLWWLLKGFGHEAVAILNGGWQAWEQQGGDVDDDIPISQGSGFNASFDHSLWVSTETIADNVNTGGFDLIDVRAKVRFIGEAEPIDPIAGHIPGALNIPLTENINEQGLFKSKAELKSLYANIRQGADDKNPVFMCGSGVTACHSIFAMCLAGHEMARVYAGSWSEWIQTHHSV